MFYAMRGTAVGWLLVVAACSVGSQAHDPAEDEVAIRALAQRAMEAENNEDLEAWLTTIADDAVVLTANRAVQGKEAIRELMEPDLAQFDWEGGWTLAGLEISGDLAVMWGPIETVLSSRESGDRYHSAGYHLDVARRQPDGSWKFTWWTTKMRSVADSSAT
jgi:uncharacterized protein (TIGR02246 family)